MHGIFTFDNRAFYSDIDIKNYSNGHWIFLNTWYKGFFSSVYRGYVFKIMQPGKSTADNDTYRNVQKIRKAIDKYSLYFNINNPYTTRC